MPSLAPLIRRRSNVAVWFIVDLAMRCPSADVVDGIRVMLEAEDQGRHVPAFLAAAQVGAHGEPLLPLLRRMKDEGEASGGRTFEVEKAIEAIEAAVKH